MCDCQQYCSNREHLTSEAIDEIYTITKATAGSSDNQWIEIFRIVHPAGLHQARWEPTVHQLRAVARHPPSELLENLSRLYSGRARKDLGRAAHTKLKQHLQLVLDFIDEVGRIGARPAVKTSVATDPIRTDDGDYQSGPLSPADSVIHGSVDERLADISGVLVGRGHVDLTTAVGHVSALAGCVERERLEVTRGDTVDGGDSTDMVMDAPHEMEWGEELLWDPNWDEFFDKK
jgi:hypothetical protein